MNITFLFNRITFLKNHQYLAFCKSNFFILDTMKLKAPYLIIISFMLFTACSLTYLEPEDEFLLDEGIQYYSEGRFGEALKIFEEFTSKYESSDKIDKAWYYKGLSEINLAEDSISEVLISNTFFELAIESFSRLNSSSKYYPESILKTGYSYYRLNNYTDSRIYLNKIISNYSMTNEIDNAFLYIGHTYRKELFYDTALVWYEKIISLYPGSSSYDNALFWAADYYFINREEAFNKEKAIIYLKEFCRITEVYDPQYYLAQNKIEVMENE